MIQRSHELYRIREQEDVGAVRRAVGRIAEDLGASRADGTRAELVACEIASNLKRHAAPGGFVLLRALGAGVEILGVDAGPGIYDLERALRGPGAEELDRLARAGARPEGLGLGLSSVQRLATACDIFTGPRLGTVVLARIDYSGAPPAGGSWRVGGVSVPMLPGTANGDGWACHGTAQELSLLVVDGLGHGAPAKEAADAALALFEGRRGGGDLAGFVVETNRALRGTRGAAASLCRIVPGEGLVQFIGIGNVEGCVLQGDGRASLLTRNGTLGMSATPPSAHVMTYPWSPGRSTLLLHTDGLHHHFDIPARCALLRHDPAVIAAAIYRDQARGRDDATVVVVQEGTADPAYVLRGGSWVMNAVASR